jgi:hypothetical protein
MQHMNQKLNFIGAHHRLFSCLVALFMACGFWIADEADCGAQDMATGSLNVTVVDPAGAFIPGAKLVLKDLGTNDVHTATTKGSGTAVIPYLSPATYSLIVSKEGFNSSDYAAVTVQTNQITNLSVTLKVGSANEIVSVSADNSPILDTTSNTVSTTIDLKQVEDLPTLARNVFSLAFLVPGAVDDNFNNLPGGAVNTSANGFSTMVNRNKSGGFDTDGPSTTMRLETTQEMTVETSELDASKGGTSAMNIGFLTKRGTNKYHGEGFEDYRSDDLNANGWNNNEAGLPRGLLIINDFGGSIGGPILKDKLFFFASLGDYRQPEQALVQTQVGTPLALSGVYTYVNATTGATQTTNVLQTGASAGCSPCTGTINPVIATDLANIQTATSLPGVTTTPLDLNHNQINYENKESIQERFPTARIDYDISPNFRMTGTVTESNMYFNNAGAPPYPGPLFSNQGTSNKERNYQVVAGFDWNIKPTLVNAFRVGYLYTGTTFDSQGVGTPTAAMTAAGDLTMGLGLISGVNGFNDLTLGFLYPVTSIKDSNTWSHGKHTVSFGVEASQEIDHYYNGQFVPFIDVNGIAQGDPVESALNSSVATGPASAPTDVQGLYATLTGRLSSYSLGQFVNRQTKQFQPGISFNLHERLDQAAVFVQDSWRASPTVTFNLGLRWDFTGASKDETGFYTHPTVPDLWGPTGVGNIFMPGSLGGVQNPVEGPHAEAYSPTYVHPEPTFGFAWNPREGPDTVLGRLLGEGKTVIRGSFTFKNYTEGAQNFWSIGSNSGSNFNTNFVANPVAPQAGVTPGAGFYNAGSVSLGQTLPALLSTSPNPFQSIVPESTDAFTGTTFATFNPKIKQPYVESWEFGLQRQLTPNNVLELRYVGNVSKDQWLTENFNEVNIFENGFLTEFKAAQANLTASGGTTFQGPNPTPILNQAFQTSGLGANFTNGQFITYLEQGQAGAFANALASNSTYLCSLIGASFSPCAANGVPGAGTYPINFFQENPYAAGAGTLELTNAGFSNYNALQVDFRQNPNHGMQFNANYTLSHSLGTSVQGSTAPGFYAGRGNSAPGFYTLRNTRLNYFPSGFDVRNVFHVSGTYDFPFGHGKQFFNKNPIANAVIGGWTIGTIVTWESGEPHLLAGGTTNAGPTQNNQVLTPQSTFNENDGGITLTGITASELQKQIHPRVVAGKPYVSLFDPKFINQVSGQANTAYIAPNTTPGTIGQLLWLHDPRNFDEDIALTKLVPIREAIHLKVQAAFLNAYNHVSWSGMDTGVQDTTFGTTSTLAFAPRQIEIRANIQF